MIGALDTKQRTYNTLSFIGQTVVKGLPACFGMLCSLCMSSRWRWRVCQTARASCIASSQFCAVQQRGARSPYVPAASRAPRVLLLLLQHVTQPPGLRCWRLLCSRGRGKVRRSASGRQSATGGRPAKGSRSRQSTGQRSGSSEDDRRAKARCGSPRPGSPRLSAGSQAQPLRRSSGRGTAVAFGSGARRATNESAAQVWSAASAAKVSRRLDSNLWKRTGEWDCA